MGFEFLIYHPTPAEAAAATIGAFPEFPQLFAFFTGCLTLTDSETPLTQLHQFKVPSLFLCHPPSTYAFRNDCLPLLGPFACLRAGSPQNAVLSKALESLTASHLPLSSREVKGERYPPNLTPKVSEP